MVCWRGWINKCMSMSWATVLSITLEMQSAHTAVAWSQAPPPRTPRMPLSSRATASQSASSSRASVCSRKTSTCRDIISCSAKQTQPSDLPCKTLWRHDSVGCISVNSCYITISRPGHDMLKVSVVLHKCSSPEGLLCCSPFPVRYF